MFTFVEQGYFEFGVPADLRVMVVEVSRNVCWKPEIHHYEMFQFISKFSIFSIM